MSKGLQSSIPSRPSQRTYLGRYRLVRSKEEFKATAQTTVTCRTADKFRHYPMIFKRARLTISSQNASALS